jgi:hypothetical protein
VELAAASVVFVARTETSSVLSLETTGDLSPQARTDRESGRGSNTSA